MSTISVHIVGHAYKVFDQSDLVSAIDEAVYYLQCEREKLRPTPHPQPEDYEKEIKVPEPDLPG